MPVTIAFIYLLPFKLSTFTNFSMLFPVMVFSFVFGENLKSHVTGDTSSLQRTSRKFKKMSRHFGQDFWGGYFK